MAWVGLPYRSGGGRASPHRPWPDTPLGARESPLIRWRKPL